MLRNGPTSHGRAKAGRPARTFIQQLCEDTGCSPKDLPEAMNDREGWRERESRGYPCWQHDVMMMMMIYIGNINLQSRNKNGRFDENDDEDFEWRRKSTVCIRAMFKKYIHSGSIKERV